MAAMAALVTLATATAPATGSGATGEETGELSLAGGTDSGANRVSSGVVTSVGAGTATEAAASAWSTAGWTAVTAAGATWFTCASALCTCAYSVSGEGAAA